MEKRKLCFKKNVKRAIYITAIVEPDGTRSL